MWNVFKHTFLIPCIFNDSNSTDLLMLNLNCASLVDGVDLRRFMSNIRPWIGIVFFVAYLYYLWQTFLSKSLENQRRAFLACPFSGLFEARQNIRLLLNTFNEEEGDWVSDNIKYMWVGAGRHCGRQGQQGGAFLFSELFEVRENIRLLLNTINEGEGDRVSLIRWKGGERLRRTR